jgi:hypothetical protein
MIFSICCWIHFSSILWGFLHLCSPRVLVYSFPFKLCPPKFRYEGNSVFIAWVQKGYLPFNLME